MRKIEVLTDSVPEFELEDTVADIHRRRQEREAGEREETEQQQQRKEEARKKEARAEESHSHEEGVAEKKPMTERSDTETEDARGEAEPSQSDLDTGKVRIPQVTHQGLSKSLAFILQDREASASATTAHDISRALTDTDSMELSMRSTDTTLQFQQVTSPTAASGCSLVDQQVMDHFTQVRSMLSSFLGQETTTHTALCNYLV